MVTYIWFIVGVFIGAIVASIARWSGVASGTLKIDCSNPEKDLYSLEIADVLDTLPKKKKIVLKIDSNADLSQK